MTVPTVARMQSQSLFTTDMNVFIILDQIKVLNWKWSNSAILHTLSNDPHERLGEGHYWPET